MIEETIKIHDQFSIELKLGYKTRRSRKINDFVVNTWIFFPGSLDINSSSYPKEDFYSDLKYNVRLITPVFLLRDIALGEQSPLVNLDEAFHKLASSPLRKNIASYEYHIKMFNSIMKSALSNEVKLISNPYVSDDKPYLIRELLKNIELIANKYRDLRRIIIVPTVGKELLDYYLLGDEFMSNQIEKYLFHLLRNLKADHSALFEEFEGQIIDFITKEREYKHSRQIPFVEEDTPDFYRDLIYRRSVLKKYFESQLFLNVQKKKDGFITEQIIFSIAAGLSMIFATGIAFVFQEKYGNFTMPLFVALVVSYMLKDRIKDLLRFYFAGKMKQKFFDHKNIIRVNGSQNLGWCKESFDFVPLEKVPGEVLKHRVRSQMMEVENKTGGENIVLYRKFLRLNRQVLNKVYKHYTIVGINDIIRLNVSRYIRMMDNADTPLYLLKNKEVTITQGERVYFLHLILNCQYDDQSRYSRYRIVFNRNGIKEVVKI